MNTGDRNSMGRAILQGSRGGRYVMVGGRRRYVRAPGGAPAPAPVAVPAGATNTGRTNIHGRRIFQGSRGGRFVMVSGRRVYRFIESSAPAPAPAATRSNAQLFSNMIDNLFSYRNIPANKYTANEKRRIAPRLMEQYQFAIQKYNIERAKPGANPDNYGRWANFAKTMFRGYRYVKPLTGNVRSPRIETRTPNRASPSRNLTNNFISLEPLQNPHLVVKHPSAETFYVNPNSLIGLIKTGSGANVKENNLKHWLRMMRQNNPDELLFAHPVSKNVIVRVKDIRFTK